MSLFADLADICHEHVPLAGRTWFGLGGPARWFLQPEDDTQLAEIVHRCHDADVGFRVLGGGSNLLVGDEGVDGAVIQLTEGVFGETRYDAGVVRAGAGVDLGDLIRATIRQELTGLEIVAAIPGTVGGAIRGNAGGRFGEISHRLVSVRIMDRHGDTHDLAREAVEFGYRWSSLRDVLILQGTFELDSAPSRETLRRYQEIWAYKKSVQPFMRGSAGCIFKNPPDRQAGKLIDEAGLKGQSVGGAVVSDRHANFIIANPGATAADVLALAEMIQEQVHAKFGVGLEFEIEIW